MAETDNRSPAVQRRRLRTELRRARLKKDLTQDQVAVEMDWSLSKVIRIERGDVGVSTNDLKALLGLYNIDDPGEAANLLTLARASRERPWQKAYPDIPPRLAQLIEFEEAASTTLNFQPLMVAGLLQTEEYARVIAGQLTTGFSDERINSLVEVRMKRQELLDRQDAPRMRFILDEAATRRVVGGKEVMQRQLRRLTEVAARPRITIQVLPFSAGAYPALNGSFVVHQFPDPEDDDVLFQEGPEGDVISRDDREMTGRYREVFGTLQRLSLTPEDSLVFLKELADTIA